MVRRGHLISNFATKYDAEFEAQLKSINKESKSINISMNEEPPFEVEVPALVKDVRKVDTGIVIHMIILADRPYDQDIFYKDGTTAISHLRRFASLFNSFHGDLAEIVGKCVVIVLKKTNYDFVYMEGIKEINALEANHMFKEIKKSCLDREEAEEEFEEEDEENEEYEEEDE